MPYQIGLPDGTYATFEDDVSEEEARQIVLRERPELFPRYEPSTGMWPAGLAQFQRMLGSLEAAPSIALGSLGDDQELIDIGQEAYRQADISARSYLPEFTTTEDISEAWEERGVLPAAAETWKWAREKFGESGAYMAPAATAGFLASRDRVATSAIGRGVGHALGFIRAAGYVAPHPIVKMGLSALAGVGTMAFQFFADNLERQHHAGAVTPEEYSVWKAAAAAPPQAAMDYLFIALTGGIGRASQIAAAQSIKQSLGSAGKEVVKKRMGPVSRQFTESLVEFPTELAQTVLERAQAGESISPSDAGFVREMFETAMGVIPVVSGFGAIGATRSHYAHKKAKLKYDNDIKSQKEFLKSDAARQKEKLEREGQEAEQRQAENEQRWNDQRARLEFQQDWEAVQRMDAIEAQNQVLPDDVNDAADSRNINRDNDPGFLAFLRRNANGKTDLNDMTPAELRRVYTILSGYGVQGEEISLPSHNNEDIDTVLKAVKNQSFTEGDVRKALGLSSADGKGRSLDASVAKEITRELVRRGLVSSTGKDKSGETRYKAKKRRYTEAKYREMLSRARKQGRLTRFIVEDVTGNYNKELFDVVANDMSARGDLDILGRGRYVPTIGAGFVDRVDFDIEETDGYLIRDEDGNVVGGATSRARARDTIPDLADERRFWVLLRDGVEHGESFPSEGKAQAARRNAQAAEPGRTEQRLLFKSKPVSWKVEVRRPKLAVDKNKTSGFKLSSTSTGGDAVLDTGEEIFLGDRAVVESYRDEIIAENTGARTYEDRLAAALKAEQQALDARPEGSAQSPVGLLGGEAVEVEVLRESFFTDPDPSIGQERRDYLFSEVAKMLKAAGLGDVALRFEERLGRGDAEAQAALHTISIAMLHIDPKASKEDQFKQLAEIISHEQIHVMRILDLFNENEWTALVRSTKRIQVPAWFLEMKGRDPKETITFSDYAWSVYGPQDGKPQKGYESIADIEEEAVADLFRAFSRDKSVVVAKPRALMDRMRQFIERLYNAITGVGYGDAGTVMAAIASGDIAARDRGKARTTSRAQRRERLMATTGGDPVTQALIDAFGIESGDEAEGRPGDFPDLEPEAAEAYAQARSELAISRKGAAQAAATPKESRVGRADREGIGRGRARTEEGTREGVRGEEARARSLEYLRRRGLYGPLPGGGEGLLLPGGVTLEGLRENARVSARRGGPDRAVAAAVASALGLEVRPGETTGDKVKIYPLWDLATTVEGADAVLRPWLERTGWNYKTFGPDEAGNGFIVPNFDEESYDQGIAWIYQPTDPHGSFRDHPYTLIWRVTHEVGHGLTNPELTRRYGGIGRRAGAMGVITPGPYTKPKDPLTLADGLRSIEWELEAFKEQRRIFEEELGISITDEEFAKENSINLSDAIYRVLTGQFGHPSDYGIVPTAIDPDSMLELGKDILRAAAAEMGIDSSETLAPKESRVGHPHRVSTRLPGAEDFDHSDSSVSVDMGAIDFDSDYAKRIVKRILEGHERPKGVVPPYPNYRPVESANTTEKQIERFIKTIQSNIEWLYDITPEKTRNRSALWYDGANELALRLSRIYDVPHESFIAVLATQSPQKDWYQNVALAERIVDTWKNQQGHVWDADMEATASRIFGEAKYSEQVDEIRGKSLSEISDSHVLQAMWIRVFSEAHHHPGYRMVLPEGIFGGLFRNKSGKPGSVQWQQTNAIAKAVSVLSDPSAFNISRRLGGQPKVRSFYSNILEPNSDRGDVTIDTHAIAAAYVRPLGSSHEHVSDAMGGGPKQKSTGMKGLYPMIAEAYRRAAASRGVLPRQMQSITWETARVLFPSTMRTRGKKFDKIEKLWKRYRSGRIGISKVRQEVYDVALEGRGDSIAPDWDGSNAGTYAGYGDSSYAEVILGSGGLRGAGARGVGGELAGGDPGVAGLEGPGTGTEARGYEDIPVADAVDAPNRALVEKVDRDPESVSDETIIKYTLKGAVPYTTEVLRDPATPEQGGGTVVGHFLLRSSQPDHRGEFRKRSIRVTFETYVNKVSSEPDSESLAMGAADVTWSIDGDIGFGGTSESAEFTRNLFATILSFVGDSMSKYPVLEVGFDAFSGDSRERSRQGLYETASRVYGKQLGYRLEMHDPLRGFSLIREVKPSSVKALAGPVLAKLNGLKPTERALEEAANAKKEIALQREFAERHPFTEILARQGYTIKEILEDEQLIVELDSLEGGVKYTLNKAQPFEPVGVENTDNVRRYRADIPTWSNHSVDPDGPDPGKRVLEVYMERKGMARNLERIAGIRGLDQWNVGFTLDGHHGRTGHRVGGEWVEAGTDIGEAQKVLSTTMAAIVEFIADVSPTSVRMAPISDSSHAVRVKLYKRFGEKYGPMLGYKSETKEDGVTILTRLPVGFRPERVDRKVADAIIDKLSGRGRPERPGTKYSVTGEGAVTGEPGQPTWTDPGEGAAWADELLNKTRGYVPRFNPRPPISMDSRPELPNRDEIRARAEQIVRGTLEGDKPSSLDMRKFSLAGTDARLPGPQQQLVDRVAPKADKELSFGKKILEAIKNPDLSWFRQKSINGYEALAKMNDIIRKINPNDRRLMADTNALAGALFHDRATGLAYEAMVRGVPVYKAGRPQVIDFKVRLEDGSEVNGGLLEILRPLFRNGEDFLRAWHTYRIGKLETRLDKEGKIVRTTAEERAAAEKLAELYPFLELVSENYNRWNSHVVQFLVDTGVISESLGEVFLRHSDYIPFFRQLYDESDGRLDKGVQALVGEHVNSMVRDGFLPEPTDEERASSPKVMFNSMTFGAQPKKRVGGKGAIVDPIEGIARNLVAALEAGSANVAAGRTMRDAILPAVDMARPVGDRSEATHTIRVKGEDRHFDVHDPLLYDCLTGMLEGNIPWLSFISAPSTLLRETVTRSPDFIMANLLRDTLSSAVTSGSNFTPIVGTATNFFAGGISGRGEVPNSYNVLRGSGVIGGYDHGRDPKDMKKSFYKELSKQGLRPGKSKTPWNMMTSLWDYVGDVTTKSDAATRMAVYDDVVATMLKEGGHSKETIETEAIFQALEIMNFSRRGNSPVMRVITAAIPFMNARIQGLDVLYRAATGKYSTNQRNLIKSRVITNFLARGMTLAVLSGLYALLVHDDDEWKNARPEVQDDNWFLPSFGDMPAMKIPIPFEVGVIFKVLPERAMRYFITESADARQTAAALTRAIVTTFEFNVFGAQVYKPVLEAMTNHSFFTGREIIPTYMKKMEPWEQKRPTTNEFASLIGKAFNVAPLNVEHIIRGYTGTVGSYAMFMMDMGLREMVNKPRPEMRADQWLIARRFLQSEYGGGPMAEFYDFKNAVERVVYTFNKMRREGRSKEAVEYARENRHILAMKSRKNSLDRMATKLREQQTAIYLSDASEGEKLAALKRIEEKRNKIFGEPVQKMRQRANLPMEFPFPLSFLNRVGSGE